MFKHWLCCLLLLVSANSVASTLLVLGDSLSAGYGIDVEQGWVKLLQKKAGDQFTVVNGSISGDTTDGGLSRLPALLDQHDPDYVLIELGGNDGLRGYPLKVMKDNLKALIELTRDAGAKPILFSMQLPPNYGKRYAEGFAAAFPQVAEEMTVPLIPFLFGDLIAEQGMVQSDGIHPTEKAQPIITERMFRQLQPLLN